MPFPPTGSFYQSTTYEELLHSTARLAQIPPADLGTEEAGFLTEYVTRAAKHAYDFWQWPETVRYSALADLTGLAADGSLKRNSGLEASGLYIYEVLALYHDDPRRTVNTREYEWTGDQDFLWIQANYPSTAVMAWRDRPPEYTATAVGGGTYDTGDLVYVAAEKDCFRALEDGVSAATWPAIENADWRRQRLPFYLKPAVAFMAYGDRLLEEGKVSRAQAVKLEADAMLDAEVIRYRDRQRVAVFARR